MRFPFLRMESHPHSSFPTTRSRSQEQDTQSGFAFSFLGTGGVWVCGCVGEAVGGDEGVYIDESTCG
jgi:hypothetical protein